MAWRLATRGWGWARSSSPSGSAEPRVPALAFCTHPETLSTNLVVHERHERRDDQREAGASPEVEQCGELVAQGLTSPRRQYQQRGHTWVLPRGSRAQLCGPAAVPPRPLPAVLTRQDPHDHTLLQRVEGLVPQLLQGLKHLSWRVCGHRYQSAWPRVAPTSQSRLWSWEASTHLPPAPKALVDRVVAQEADKEPWAQTALWAPAAQALQALCPLHLPRADETG